MSAIVQWSAHSLVLPFWGIGMRIDCFQSCGHCWVFQICWHIKCSTFTASSLRVWNSSTGIPSPALALLTTVLPKAHLTSLSRMSGSGWLTTPSQLSGSLRSFLYSSSKYFVLISSASTRSIPFLSFTVPTFGWSVTLISPIFLKRSLVFPLLLFSSSFMHCSLNKVLLSLCAVLLNSEFSWVYLSLSPLFFTSLLSLAICKASLDNHFAFLFSFSLEWFCLLSPVQYFGPMSLVFQA